MRKLCYLFEHVKLCMRNMLTAFDGVSGVGDGGREFGRGEGHNLWG